MENCTVSTRYCSVLQSSVRETPYSVDCSPNWNTPSLCDPRSQRPVQFPPGLLSCLGEANSKTAPFEKTNAKGCATQSSSTRLSLGHPPVVHAAPPSLRRNRWAANKISHEYDGIAFIRGGLDEIFQCGHKVLQLRRFPS